MEDNHIIDICGESMLDPTYCPQCHKLWEECDGHEEPLCEECQRCTKPSCTEDCPLVTAPVAHDGFCAAGYRVRCLLCGHVTAGTGDNPAAHELTCPVVKLRVLAAKLSRMGEANLAADAIEIARVVSEYAEKHPQPASPRERPAMCNGCQHADHGERCWYDATLKCGEPSKD